MRNSFIFFEIYSKMDIVRWGTMGIFDKFKNIFIKHDKEEVEVYDKGLEKTRKEFSSIEITVTLKAKV